jgi:hypothetical protein
MKPKAKEKITIHELDFAQAEIKIYGKTPLIVHRFDEKSKKQMLDKQTKKDIKAKEAKDPEQQYLSSIYYFKDGRRTGFPANGFKAAMVRAGKQLGLIMTDLRGQFWLLDDGENLVEINGSHRLREDMVRLNGGTADIRYRAEYPVWEATVRIEYLPDLISEAQLTSLLQLAGVSCGIGEWRPEKCNSGTFGTFTLKKQ